ncbi:uncharacterized protein PSFLO_02003 [Pseudozyma flocculosa]|uniref:Uncharacterized protein n=1 Tax=Pseudozyma flocculosa TaxID=84751 RepID=A0A5C3EWT8_9BASI|nr:uncharacterized protein PSFLO_02003 [Pseudozyma flocculosa]
MAIKLSSGPFRLPTSKVGSRLQGGRRPARLRIRPTLSATHVPDGSSDSPCHEVRMNAKNEGSARRTDDTIKGKTYGADGVAVLPRKRGHARRCLLSTSPSSPTSVQLKSDGASQGRSVGASAKYDAGTGTFFGHHVPLSAHERIPWTRYRSLERSQALDFGSDEAADGWLAAR